MAERTIRVWIKAYELGKAVPTPMAAVDQMSAMVPGFTMLGTQQALDFYQELYDELKYRVDNKIGIVPEEKYRVLWAGGLPPWFALNMLTYFESRGAVFPTQVPYGPMGTAGAGAEGVLDSIPVEVSHPLERMAWRFFKCWTYWYEDAQKRSGVPEVEQLIKLIDDYRIDGALMHRAFSCRTTHVGQINILNVLKQYRDIPGIILESDIIDARTYSEPEVQMRIDAFVELMDAYKRRKMTTGA
jgi:benzoyl-CoA reductase/2-hydroxyglutaryl-CoA dehydratase subunit BcrC/BadD/HgdB